MTCDVGELCNIHSPFFSLQVMGAKIVTYARTPGVRCFGYITMATSEDASKCIQYLHRTEIHGRMISVERVRSVRKFYGLFTRGTLKLDRGNRMMS
jgi:RNA recognition motif-containing protein